MQDTVNNCSIYGLHYAAQDMQELLQIVNVRCIYQSWILAIYNLFYTQQLFAQSVTMEELVQHLRTVAALLDGLAVIVA